MYLHHHDNPRFIITRVHNINSSLQYLVIHYSAKTEQAQHNLNTLWSIITYFGLLLHTQGVQLNLIAEGNIGTLEVDRLILAVYLDLNGEENFQPTLSTRRLGSAQT